MPFRRPRGATAPTPPTRVLEHLDELLHHIPATLVDTSCLASPANVPHGSHTTNLHTHGIHVQPGNESERHPGGQHVPSRAAQGGLGDPPARRRRMPPHARTARARRRSRLRVRARQRHGVTIRPARHAPAPSSRHALVSPALPWRDTRSSRQRPRRLFHRRRRCRRCDQPRDDRNGAAGSDREDRTVRLPRTRHADSARRGVISRYGRRSPPQPGPPAAAGGDQRRILTDGDLHASRRRGAVARAQRERRRPRHEELHGARGAVRVRGSTALEGQARRDRFGSADRGAGNTAGRRVRDADHLPAVVRRHHAGHGGERPRPAHHQGSLEAERGIAQPARSAAGGGEDPRRRCCATSRTATATARTCGTCSSVPIRFF